jgi:G3E family GTPase
VEENMSQIEFVLQFSEEAKKQYMIQTGERPNERYSLELKDFTPEERARILSVDRYLMADRVPQNKADWMALIEAHLEEMRQNANQKAQEYLDMSEEELVEKALYRLSTYKPTDDPVRILKLQSADEALKSSLRQRWAKAVQQALEKKAEEEQKKQAERKAREEREKAEQERKEALRQAWEKMREEWILAHGSERLVKAFKMGYACSGLFEKEFAAFHFPNAECDWHDEADWEKRRCPSMKALQRLEEYQKRFPDWEFRIVWLTSPPRPFGMHDEDYAARTHRFEPCEAIVIEIPGFNRNIVEKV